MKIEKRALRFVALLPWKSKFMQTHCDIDLIALVGGVLACWWL